MGVEVFFLAFALLFALLFVIFAMLRQPIKAKFNIFYCGFCYASVAAWMFLLALWLLGFSLPFELLAMLLGMSAMGIWNELMCLVFLFFTQLKRQAK
ncbi:MAG: hypothetical protein CVU81_00190 [Euryarchaeota archaeon HGW-Euryarchaeota-1]|nr:MAG: hypothetical protein CVU81_00190 [Euryarchaeota archaeon HGW-Euryarchaeota-1]